MKTRNGQPRFTPLVIELETPTEIRIFSCIINFVVNNSKVFTRIYDWFSTFYRHNLEETDEQDFQELLKGLEVSLDRKLGEL